MHLDLVVPVSTVRTVFSPLVSQLARFHGGLDRSVLKAVCAAKKATERLQTYGPPLPQFVVEPARQDCDLMNTSRKARIEGMDAVRMLAISLVLLTHDAGSPRFPFPNLNRSFLHLGRFGVLLFFVLSGYLQTKLLLSDERKFGQINLKLFYCKRLLRIVPTMAVYLAFLGLWWCFTNYKGSLLSIAAPLLCLRQVFDGDPLTAHFWSLSLEILFYLAWPVMLIRFEPRVRIKLAVASIIVLPLISGIINAIIPDTPQVYWSKIIQADPIFVGCWLALTERQTNWIRRVFSFGSTAALGAIIVGLAAALFVDHWMRSHSSYGMTKIGDMLEVLLATWIVNAALQINDGPAHRLVALPVVKYAALISFGIYVWQQFFFFGNPNDWLFEWPKRSLYFPLFWFPLNLIAACFAGVLSYLLIEVPLAPWRDRLTRKIVGASTASEALSDQAGDKAAPLLAVVDGSSNSK